jgi:hypothetical protein
MPQLWTRYRAGFAFFNRFQLEIIDFSCGSRSRGQNKDARAAMTAHAIPTTTRMKRAHSDCMKPPENLSVPWATYCIQQCHRSRRSCALQHPDPAGASASDGASAYSVDCAKTFIFSDGQGLRISRFDKSWISAGSDDIFATHNFLPKRLRQSRLT